MPETATAGRLPNCQLRVVKYELATQWPCQSREHDRTEHQTGGYWRMAMEQFTAQAGSFAEGRKSKLASLRATTIGNVLEWLDWTLYATFAPYLAKALFRPSDPVSALLQTLAVFAVGFVARPVGSIVISRFADRRGRGTSLLISMILMAIGSVLLAANPTYSQVGVGASIWLLVARLIQGFAHGGETCASFVYVSELAPSKSRGLWSSSIFASSTFGVILGSLMGVTLTALLSADELASWGWRIPFVFGSLLGIFAYFLRRNLAEPEAALASKRPAQLAPIDKKASIQSCVRLFFIIGGTGIPYYTWLSFATTLAITERHIPPNHAFLATLVAQVLCMLALPVFGMISDRIGRKPLALLTTAGFAVISFPLDWILGYTAWSLMLAQAVALVLWAGIGSIYPAFMAEQFPAGPRASGIGIAYSTSVVVFGGTAPYLNAWLSSHGLHWMFTAYGAVMCAIAAVMVMGLREEKGNDLVA
jgi:MFS transporter, MHS family, alpha-ketoglutarate permease